MKQVYAKTRKIDSKKMDFWNMHTLTGKTIASDKITLLKVNDSYNAMDIIMYLMKHTNYDLKVLTPLFHEFLQFYHFI